MGKNYVITIARGFGSGGKTIGQMLAGELSIEYFDRDILRLASEESGIYDGFLACWMKRESGVACFEKMGNTGMKSRIPALKAASLFRMTTSLNSRLKL